MQISHERLKAVGQMVGEVRQALGLTQTELGHRVTDWLRERNPNAEPIDQPRVSRIERASEVDPDLDELQAFAQVLGMEKNALVRVALGASTSNAIDSESEAITRADWIHLRADLLEFVNRLDRAFGLVSGESAQPDQ